MTRIRVLYIPLGIYCYFTNLKSITTPYPCLISNTIDAGTTYISYCIGRGCNDCVLDISYFLDHKEEFLVEEVND